jgi:phosphotransferase system IIB component
VGISQIIIIAAVVLLGLAASGCKRNHLDAPVEADTNAAPVVTNAPAAPIVPGPSRTRDLGVLQLTNHCETTIQLGAGKSCTITPHLIDPKRLQLTMVLETKMPDGKTKGLNIMKVVSQPDQQFEFVFGGLSLTVTPQMAVETNAPAKTP